MFIYRMENVNVNNNNSCVLSLTFLTTFVVDCIQIRKRARTIGGKNEAEKNEVNNIRS